MSVSPSPFLVLPSLHISSPKLNLDGEIFLPSSKSESNRALIIEALCEKKCSLMNLSEARDTKILQNLLNKFREIENQEEYLQSNIKGRNTNDVSLDLTLDVQDAGTTMRFLTAFCTIKNHPTLLKGTDRMHQRPIKELVLALRELGAQITYENEDGFPPLFIHGFSPESQTQNISIQGNISSQYISAVLMIAPLLPKGILLEIIPPVSSEPYIKMTLELMQHFGILHSWTENRIIIPHQQYSSNQYKIESDWSAASYWYSMAAICSKSELFLKGLREKSWQGDNRIVKMMKGLGIRTHYEKEGVRLQKTSSRRSPFKYDFTPCPDLAQTMAVLCAALGVEANMTGLHSLKIKETDRLTALKIELAKFGAEIEIINDNELHIPICELHAPTEPLQTYHDHRMAMAFAPLALLFPITIESPEVVQKSYPSFWEDMEKMGFRVK
ncbi:3-phosphoshikimate 1-carboxyvinyltransferase [Bernardetia litoralis DSM 6794]|uniref:3-phosphoshikimate 1-carboxyvinyltransferase n=1 Tax=Bernardetia litoralis (strain ATCC 23117 / DSM 6794 / NBRC 15988 / NCIMB 1366 / Fx l1 / Sio-4) TaxID=880071 RepID=I4AMC7_BERLS|nr:3-phosphoshikimate 1-carboxyvinyltransferase [Bernardetia litoralis]AFM05112.1 3-phosphoshikimate 1-carboxyvinyltransferase [Bernardetia litoralis DSM 6794]